MSTPFTRRLFLERASAAGLFSAIAGCGQAAREAGAQDDGTLIIGLATEPLALSSAGSIDGGASVVSPQLFDRLFATNLQGELVPQLAVSGELSPDGLQATINLRPGVRWHDGTPLTSADVAFSIEHVWKALLPRSQVAFARLTGIDTPTAEQAVLHFASPAPYLLNALADVSAQIVPRHIYEGGDILTNPNNRAPIGSGPFMFEEWRRGEYLVLRRNPDYWDAPHPYLDRLIFRFVAAGAMSSAALEGGTIQYSGDVPVSDIARFESDPRFTVQKLGTEYFPGFFGFAFNLNKPHLQDRRVRQAFAHAIDKRFVVDNIWQGYARIADSPVPPGTEWHAPGLPDYAFDLDRAAALLDEAGLTPGADGVRLRLTNDIMPPSALSPRAAQYIRQSLAQIGVELQLRSETLSSYLRRVFTERDWDTLTFSTGSDHDPALGIQRFYTSSSIQIGVPFTNPTHYATPEMDALFEAAQTEMDRDRRRALYAQIQEILQTDLPSIPILFPQTTDVGVKRLSHTITLRGGGFKNARFVSDGVS